MTVSSGFFNSVSGDRKYNAKHFNEIFDGLLSDGVYVNVGDAFKVTPGTGMQVVVGTGRGWFKNTWILNDAALPINITSADPILSRIDAIVIDINTSTNVRNNSIVYKQGTAATTPDKPSLVNESAHKQYPIAWIRIDPGVTSISSNKIIDCQLTGELPAIEALLEYSSHTKAEIDERFTRDENPSFNDRTGALANIASGEAMTSMLGKIKQVFATLIGHTSNKATFYRHDGAFATPPTVDTTQPGYCPTLPAYSSGDHKYLRDDGTWVIPPNTQNNNAVTQNSANNTNANYKVMLTGRAAAENAVENTLWDADLTYNPSTNQLNVKKIVGDSVNGVKFGTSGNNRGYYDANGNFKTFRQPSGNATAAQVLTGYSFANASSDAVNGSMPNQGAKTASLNCGGSYTIPAGYHNGSGKVTANSLASQTKPDSGKTAVAAAQMLTGYQGWVNGNKITGSMPNYSGNSRQTVTPSGGTGNEQLSLTAGYHNSVIVNRTAPYNQGITDADARVNTNSASYNSGVTNAHRDLKRSSLKIWGVHNISGITSVRTMVLNINGLGELEFLVDSDGTVSYPGSFPILVINYNSGLVALENRNR